MTDKEIMKNLKYYETTNATVRKNAISTILRQKQEIKRLKEEISKLKSSYKQVKVEKEKVIECLIERGATIEKRKHRVCK